MPCWINHGLIAVDARPETIEPTTCVTLSPKEFLLNLGWLGQITFL